MSFSFKDLKALERQSTKPKVGLQSLRQTVKVHINTPGLAVALEFSLIIAPAPDEILRRMIWEIQQELSKRGAKAE